MPSALHRFLPTAALVVAGLGAPALVSASQPGFIRAPLYSTATGEVQRIVEADSADIVVLRDGLLEGFVAGQICEVVRGETVVAELVLSDSFLNFSVGLITNIADGATIEPGDAVRIKTR